MLTFVISNIADQARTQSYQKEFQEQGILNYEVFPAIMYPKMARKGISMSHKACVQIAKDRGEPCVHIHEDDCWYLQKGAYKRFLGIYHTEVPKDADMVFGGNYDGIFTPITSRLALAEGKKAGMISYIVNSHFFNAFLSADENYNIDHFLTAPDLGNAKCYTCYPMLVLQHDGLSYNTGVVTNYNQEMHRRFRLWDGKE